MNTSCEAVTTATQTCVVCPEVPAIAAVPARTIIDPRFGWNASAHSVQLQAGDCQTTFSAPAVVGLVLGFANARASNHPSGVQHGFYLYQSAGRDVYAVIENGLVKLAAAPRTVATDLYRIERRGDAVVYLVSGTTVYTSTSPSRGTLMVVACMYSAPDGVN